MTYEELKIKLDLYDPEDVLKSAGKLWKKYYGKSWFVVCDDGDCHVFKEDGTEDDIRKIDSISNSMLLEDIKKIVIPDSVTHIWDYAFFNCSGLTSMMISDSMTSIGEYAFCSCSGLTDMTIGASVTSIGFCAFHACNKLKSLVFRGKTMNEIEMMNNYPWEIEDKSVIRCA